MRNVEIAELSPIATFGAYDRFNFGDLLFPILLDRTAAEYGIQEPLAHFALRAARTANVGGVNVGAFRHRCHEIHTPLRAIVLGGGEILGATWGQALVSLLSRPWDLALLATERYVSPRLFDSIGRLALRGESRTPYVPSVAQLDDAELVCNAIGGSSIVGLRPREERAVIETLKRAAYLSVRDEASAQELRARGLLPHVAPDSAALIARYFPKSERVSERVATFQCSRAWLRGSVDVVSKQLNMLAPRFDVIELLPIGLAGGHADDVALHNLASVANGVLETKLRVVPVASVQDVRKAIERSAMFIGTSLHGHIVSAAYGVPSVALNKIDKLTYYVNTWGNDLTPCEVRADEISSAVDVAESCSPELIRKRSLDLASAAWEGATQMFDSLRERGVLR